ncbi:HTH myb-type domain-containing protein [Chloropicon primus]|uniref:Uncharacterized protein n=1 Tax=Chloropicon primus TaxID=1764295 RepID=A0A5B8MF78_9CHLO|nr:hypothetical protein A3770_02p13420 [Chloropicon primus]UPQ98031.1 HTH myb-type domain-containing protein [Chloropicon primus]|mmetsp:Transcript_5120/g.15400  ORF Transcript_5120/g.15400 Transcript_5120/m.15400 type:complete len:336 (-) Transcript_5120:132-1139(-)|eukprot:QDZ18824.1 hypothetical protein A3770_02p13420 [Chloropicon primus]
MVQTNLIRDLQNRGVAVQNGDAQHTYNSLCMNDAIKMEVERSQLMYKHDMVDSMLSQLANIDQDTNLPVNSYDIDLPMWMTMDQGDPFADVELGSDLSNLRDRFFPDANNLKHGGGLGGHGLGGGMIHENALLQHHKANGGGGLNGKAGNGSSAQQQLSPKKSRGGSKKGGAGKGDGAAGSTTKRLSGVNGMSKSVKKQSANGKGNGSPGKGKGSVSADGSNGDASAEGSNGNGHRRKKHHNPWTAEETQALIEGVSICGGGKWADIKKLGLKAIERRSAVDLKDKWRNLLRVALLPQQTLRQIERKREVSSEMLAKVRVLSAKYNNGKKIKSKA